jgi:hypothetical protein
MKKSESNKERTSLAEEFDFCGPFFAAHLPVPGFSNSLPEKKSNLGCLDFLTQNIPYLKAVLIVDSSFEILKIKTIDSDEKTFPEKYQRLCDFFKVENIHKLSDSQIFLFEDDLIFSYKLGLNSIVIVISNKILSKNFSHNSFFSNK